MAYQPGVYGTYPGKRADFALMMNSQDVELQPLDTSAGTPMRSILRNKGDTPARDFYDVYDSYDTSARTKVQIQNNARSRKSSKCRYFCGRILRPYIAEYLSVLISIVVYFHVEAQLIQRHVIFFHKIVVLAVVEAVLYSVFLATFQTVHLNPVVSVAQLFTLTTQWYLCLLFIVAQFFGAITGMVILLPLNAKIKPQLPTIIHDLNRDWIVGVFEMVVCQTLGTTIVILANLLVTRKCHEGSTSWRQLARNPLCASAAVGLASLLSLFHSNISWNPLHTLVLLSHELFAHKGLDRTLNDLLFWLGPVVGALLGSIVFKLLFAPFEDPEVTTEEDVD